MTKPETGAMALASAIFIMIAIITQLVAPPASAHVPSGCGDELISAGKSSESLTQHIDVVNAAMLAHAVALNRNQSPEKTYEAIAMELAEFYDRLTLHFKETHRVIQCITEN